MNLSKRALNKYLNKIFKRAEKYLLDEIKDPYMAVDAEITCELEIGITLGIFQEFDTWDEAVWVLNRPFLGGCYYDEQEDLQEFKDGVLKWLTPEAKKTLGIKEKQDESVKAEAH